MSEQFRGTGRRKTSVARVRVLSNGSGQFIVNKKAIDVLVRAEALNNLVDERFNNLKHFWSAVVENRPKSKKKLNEMIEEYKDVEDFTRDEVIENKINLSGIYPFGLIMSDDIKKRLDNM